ncbi:putative cytochrome b5-like Heme/Steroid binding domain protein [Clostridiales bacterium oral taxon 876 str. F0540]|nr:putative cytochrome b5-like Heme/Steroid binding domain protein [Clostridiales bacterium oral taxon 876 str. F0540]
MKKIFIASILGTLIILGGCSNKTVVENKPVSESNVSTEVSSNKEFTLDELKKYNGQNGNPAYVAVDGVVYDVTHAKGWRNGKHEGGITAGNDLSNEINKSPHGKDVLNGLTIIGKLK